MKAGTKELKEETWRTQPNCGWRCSGRASWAGPHSIAYAILPSFFPELPPVRRQVVVDVTEDLARGGAHQFGFDEWVTSWKEAIARSDIDIVDIVTPNDSHEPLAHAALAAGKYVLCQQPLALTDAQATPLTAFQLIPNVQS